MGYYCTVPQCTSLAGKTKNVKFHRFPRDDAMAEKWNVILKRMKPITKYSKVCSLHFTQSDYNVTTMGQWKTLSKDAVPTQNLPKLNPDGTVMVIRKSRTVKYREAKKEDVHSDKDKWQSTGNQMQGQDAITAGTADRPVNIEQQESILAYRLQGLNSLPQSMSPADHKPKKQDAIMQTDPVTDDENPINFDSDKFEVYPNDYMKNKEYLPQTADEYNKEAEKYALERKSSSFEKNLEFQKSNTFEKTSLEYSTNDGVDKNVYQKTGADFEKNVEFSKPVFDKSTEYQKNTDAFEKSMEFKSDAFEKPAEFAKNNNFGKTEEFQKTAYDKALEYSKNGGFDKDVEYKDYQKMDYEFYYQDSVEVLRNQQQNLQLLQEQHRLNENQNFFDENHIKQEIEFPTEEDKFFDRSKESADQSAMFEEQRRLVEQIQQQVKQEPDVSSNNGHENIMQPQSSPYFNANGNNITDPLYTGHRPGPELLIAKQNALAAHTQLWQNTMKRPFFYSENNLYNAPPLLHRYEDLSRILQ